MNNLWHYFQKDMGYTKPSDVIIRERITPVI